MKKKIIFLSIELFVGLFLLAFISCNNDFLHVEQKVSDQVTDTISMSNLDASFPVNFNLPQAGNAHWRVLQFPTWMKVSQNEGNFSEGKSTFQLEIPDKYMIPGYGIIDCQLVFEVKGIGLVQYPIRFMNFGNPHCGLSTYDISLEYQSLAVFTIQNMEGGILLWEIKDKPSWISVSKQSGYLNPNSAEQITLLISRDNLEKGSYSGEINIATNSNEQNLKLKVSMKVSDPSISGTVENIEGEVVDADFCKTTGLMVVAAKNPNRLYFFKSDHSMKTLELNKIPISVTVSETGDLVAATFTNTDLSLISTESLTITKNIQTGIITSDVALGGNGWAYISPKPYSSDYLLSVNLNTGETIKLNEYMNGLTFLKKVPGKNLLYGTKVGWSPDFLLVFDISKGAVNSVVDQWWTTLWKFWLSEDGLQVFSGMRKIYRSPDYLGKGNMMEAPALSGEFEEISGTISAMDHCAALKELLIVYKAYSYEVGTRVLKIDDSGYFTKAAFSVNNLTVNENGNTLSLAPEVPYMFISKLGNELHLIKKGMANSGFNYWSYERISLK
jgi:hypothetical protein